MRHSADREHETCPDAFLSRRQRSAIGSLLCLMRREGCVRLATRREKKRDRLDCRVLLQAPEENPAESASRGRKSPGGVHRCCPYSEIQKPCRRARRPHKHGGRRKRAFRPNWIRGRYRGCLGGPARQCEWPKAAGGARPLRSCRKSRPKPPRRLGVSGLHLHYRLRLRALELFAQIRAGAGDFGINATGKL